MLQRSENKTRLQIWTKENRPPVALKRDPQDIEMDNLRRQVQQLQECLEHVEAFEHDASHHGSDVEVCSEDGEDVNPFHQARSHASSDSTPPHPQDLRNQGVQRHYWTFQNLKEECNPMNSLIGLTPLSESLIAKMF
jgi:hypothetical protein